MLGLIIVTILTVVVILLLRWLASSNDPRFVAIVPGQNYAVVITKPNTEVLDKDGNPLKVNNDGGNITNVIHAIPGMVLNRSNLDPMEWYFEKGREDRGLLYYLFGIQFIGLFRYLHLSDVRTFRYGRKDKEKEYSVMAKSHHARFRFFSGQHDIWLEGIETVGILKLNFLYNIIYHEKYPVRVRFRTADPFAVMTMMVKRRVIGFVGAKDPKEIIGKEDLKEELRRLIKEDLEAVEDQLGLGIMEVNEAEITFDDETRKLLEQETVADINAKAKVREAEGDRDAQVARNTGDADRIKRVIIPAARDERTVAVRIAEAYENNETVTTFAPGGTNTMIPLGK